MQGKQHHVLSRVTAGAISKRFLPALPFFLVYFVCLWTWIDVKLIYHGGGLVKDFPSFYLGWEYAREFRTHPGGLAEYGSALLAQALYSSWFGALALTFQAALISAGTSSLLGRFGAEKFRLFAFVPPLLILAIYSKYRHYSVPVTSFAAGVLCSWVWLRFNATNARWRLGSALLIEGCLYAAAPSGLVVFLPVALLVELRLAAKAAQSLAAQPLGAFAESSRGECEAAQRASHRAFVRTLPLLLWLCVSALIPWIEGAWLFGFAPGEAYAKLLPIAWDPVAWKMTAVWIVALLYALPLLVCIGTVVSWIGRGLLRRGSGEVSAVSKPPIATGGKRIPQRDPRQPKKRSLRPTRRLEWVKLQMAGASLLPIATVWLVLNVQTKVFLLVDYLAWHGRWPEILSAAQSNSGNSFVACTVAQASYHTGTLIRQLPILGKPADLLLFEEKQQSHWRKSDLYYDLGYLNMALHHLTESVEFYGERPVLLRRIALVNLALGNFSTAKVYLGTLARAPFQGAWARSYLEKLAGNSTLDGDEEVRRLRQLMVRTDTVVVLTLDEELLMLLGTNRQNRMAFEYLMTYYLMTKNLRGFAKNISRVNDFLGFEIPSLWDEALLLAGRELGEPVKVPGHEIGREAMNRVERVTQSVRRSGSELGLAARELAANYGDTYSYYWYFAER